MRKFLIPFKRCFNAAGLRSLDVGDLHMAQTLESRELVEHRLGGSALLHRAVEHARGVDEPVRVVEVEARCIDAEEHAVVLALEDEEAEFRDLLGVIDEPNAGTAVRTACSSRRGTSWAPGAPSERRNRSSRKFRVARLP